MERILNKETAGSLGKKVKVSGWVNTRRDHGKIIFIDLRDRSGIVQAVFTPRFPEACKTAKPLRPEWVVSLQGSVKKRPPATVNENLPTGEIEIEVESLEILSEAKTLPFSVETDGYEISEEKRLKYRYLDIRRPRMKKNLETRQEVIQYMRTYLQEKGFLEVETPMLTRSTPEGARDFLVPSRLYPGKFYALPQSPQQYKQLLQVAGVERYFQIARCLRDEDPRADRQAEHTQLDIETSFMGQEEILSLVENLYSGMVKKIFPEKKISFEPFPKLTYEEAIKKYGTDKPDLRKDKKDKDELAFCFVVDFPMFEWHKKEKNWGPMHHPFTRPREKNPDLIKKNPGDILAHQYDFVLNGVEIGGGSLRTTDPKILEAVFQVLKHGKKEVQEMFSHYFEAFGYGVPPHGGIAPGIDRFLAVALNEDNIREVMAFPKTGDNRDLMMQAPAGVSKEQLKELKIKIEKPKKKK